MTFEPEEWDKGNQEYPEQIDLKIKALFQAAKEQDFEDGMESEFSRKLVSLVYEYDNVVIEVIANHIFGERVNAKIASEALRWLGHMDHFSSHTNRLWLLERSLFCSSARIRDGAALGLSFLDDPHAITPLKQAIQYESYTELRESLEQVLAQLEKTQRCHFS